MGVALVLALSSRSTGEGQLHLGGPLQVPSYLLSTSQQQAGGRAVSWSANFQAAFPGNMPDQHWPIHHPSILAV